MDVFIFTIVNMVLLMIAGAATHRSDIVKVEAILMVAWIAFAAINTEPALKFSSFAALGAYLVLLLLPKSKKED